MLGLPADTRSRLFDVDGVLTDTTSVHPAARKEMLDAFRQEWSRVNDVAFGPFELVSDYGPDVDCRPRPDGVIARERGIPGRPAPDTFLAAADLRVPHEQAVVFDDAALAGKAGGFGVDRLDQADALRAQGADVVVSDLAELLEDQP